MGITVAQDGADAVDGVPVGIDAFVEEYALGGVIEDEGANRLARILARMPDK